MNVRPLRVAIAGGGTGGHVLPAVAVVEELRRRGSVGDILWIGSHDGVERDAAAEAAITFRSIPTGKLRRYPSARTAVDAFRVPAGVAKAWRLLRGFRPTVVFSSGGFVSVPTVIAAARSAPILAHEQTAIVGLANRVNARFADVLAVSWDATRIEAERLHRRVVVTGNPVRGMLRDGDAARGLARYGFVPDLPLLYVTGGARGASPLNRRLGHLLPDLLASCQVLHQTGPAVANDDAADLASARETWPEGLRSRYHVTEYVRDEIADVYAAASLVLGRAGAGTVAELAFLGKPAILVPLPGAGGDEQTRNGLLLADVGGAIVLPERDATPVRLGREIRGLLADPARLRNMSDAVRSMGRPDAAARIVDELLALSGAEPAGRANPR